MRPIVLPGVFRPRSDSRMLAGRVAALARPGSSSLDLFTGSGICAAAAAKAGARAEAVDVSRRAVWTVRMNARLGGVSVRAHRGDMFEPVAGRTFDVISANPPYVPGDEIPDRGPARAWEAGPDGRRFLDRLCREAADHLNPGGTLAIVQSSICDTDRTIELLGESGLDAAVAARRIGPLGPLMRDRASDAGPTEEIVVIEARHAQARAETRRVPETAPIG